MIPTAEVNKLSRKGSNCILLILHEMEKEIEKMDHM